MHETKAKLIEKNGLRCMLCGEDKPYRQLQWHHVKWKSICKKEHIPVDNSYENGVLLCVMCHSYVHTLDYYSLEYRELMQEAISNREPKALS